MTYFWVSSIERKTGRQQSFLLRTPGRPPVAEEPGEDRPRDARDDGHDGDDFGRLHGLNQAPSFEAPREVHRLPDAG